MRDSRNTSKLRRRSTTYSRRTCATLLSMAQRKKERTEKENLTLHLRRDADGVPVPEDRPIPTYPVLEAINPGQPGEFERRTKFIEAMRFYRRSLQYILS
eukprot:1363212-Amphidinium_carterae.3